jgi:hypothetical protein
MGKKQRVAVAQSTREVGAEVITRAADEPAQTKEEQLAEARRQLHDADERFRRLARRGYVPWRWGETKVVK